MPSARAVRIREPGGPEVLELVDVDVRDPGPGELLVDVHAAGLNRADVLQRRGFYPAPPGSPPDIPGLEYAGTVAAVGPGPAAFAPGDRVMGIVGGGAMASRIVVHEREAIPVPRRLSIEQAAAIPEVFLTVYDALVVQGRLSVGEVLLVHAVGSGIGTAALQLGRVAGAVVVGTSRSPEKLERCAELGLLHRVLVGGDPPSFAEAVRAQAGRASDLVLDTIGAAYLAENVRAVATRGRIVTIGLLGGPRGQIDLGLLLTRRATLTGTVLRSRPLEEKAALAQAFIRNLLPLFEDERLVPVVEDVMSFTAVADAHRRLESNATFGKLVLSFQP